MTGRNQNVLRADAILSANQVKVRPVRVHLGPWVKMGYPKMSWLTAETVIMAWFFWEF